jgi:hypothetical protein
MYNYINGYLVGTINILQNFDLYVTVKGLKSVMPVQYLYYYYYYYKVIMVYDCSLACRGKLLHILFN